MVLLASISGDPHTPEVIYEYVNVGKCLLLWGDIHGFHDNFKGVHDSPNVKNSSR